MENKIRLLPLIGLLSLMLLAEGCATVRKGASSVADGTGAVVEGVGSALTALAPKRQGDAADEEEIVQQGETVVVQAEPVPAPDMGETTQSVSERRNPVGTVASGVGKGLGAVGSGIGSAGGSVARGVGSVFGGLAPKKQDVEVKPGEEAKGDMVEVEVDGEVKRFVQKRPSINPFKTYPFKPLPNQEGDVTTNQIMRAQAWSDIVDISQVRLIGDDRMRIDILSPFVMSVEEMEYVLLARAAGEASRAGFPRFSIVYLNYKGGKGLSNLLLPEIKYGGSDWIGTYEDLITERESQRLTGNVNRIGAKRLEAVILLQPAENRRQRETFAATETYLNMLNNRKFEGQYPYGN
ncbi:hypothetical protein [Parvularcula sp. IMCC14364]|uniref:hypothetical protein n=1 Tax=Parvularcula sp. IMCC14364 TaxID=3067902 RepID=UPI00274199AE|nr:hypothetical protein [Parvularcula sp. IMCC14364]